MGKKPREGLGVKPPCCSSHATLLWLCGDSHRVSQPVIYGNRRPSPAHVCSWEDGGGWTAPGPWSQSMS